MMKGFSVAGLYADNRERPGLRGGSVEVRWGFIGAGDVTRVRAPPGEAFTQEGSRVLFGTESSHRLITVGVAGALGTSLR